MTTNTVKHTPDATDSIADDLLRNGYERWLRLEEEKAAIGDDLKELFAELKAQGFTPKALRESFRRVRNADNADQQEHDAIVELYVASLTRARPAHTRGGSYSEAKGRGEADAKLVATVATGVQTEIGRKALVAALDIMIEREEGEQNEPEAAAEVAGDYLREPVAAEQGQIIREGDAPRETDRLGGDASCPDAEYSHSQASPRPADTAGEVHPSSQASPASKSDDIDLTIPDFLKRTDGYPKREAVGA